MNSFKNLTELNDEQKIQYGDAISNAFPKIISESKVIKKHWSKLENYFPEYQQFMISTTGQLIGFINVIPFQFGGSLSDLPDTGWDWMFVKGITDHENKISPNYLGGLQVIVRKKYKRQGYSKQILNHAKHIFKSLHLLNLVIPIRPIKKHEFPKMSMSAYLDLKKEHKIYDPWIRTHVDGGAEIIKVCKSSMTMNGDLEYWEKILNKKIHNSGEYPLKGALSLIKIDIENNIGQYIEPNIWLKYD